MKRDNIFRLCAGCRKRRIAGFGAEPFGMLVAQIKRAVRDPELRQARCRRGA